MRKSEMIGAIPGLSTVLLVLVTGVAMAQSATQQLPVLPVSIGIHAIRAEVAHTYETRARGLMQRPALGPNEGMLFVFPDAGSQCMWMKNTLIPLSVAFIDEGGSIINVEEMQPHSEQTHCAKKPAKFALEMTRAWFSGRQIKPGVRIQGIDKAPAPR